MLLTVASFKLGAQAIRVNYTIDQTIASSITNFTSLT